MSSLLIPFFTIKYTCGPAGLLLDCNRNLIRKRMVLIILQPEAVLCEAVKIMNFRTHDKLRRVIGRFFYHFLHDRYVSVINVGIRNDMNQFPGL